MLRLSLLLLAAAIAAGCSGQAASPEAAPGSTLESTLVDRDGDGVLERGPGERLIERTDLAPAARAVGTLATFAQISDAHLTDEESPLRVEAVDRLGGRATSASRPQEALTAQVLAAAQVSLERIDLDAVLVTGDLIDGAQANELSWVLRILEGGRVRPDSGAPGYDGVQRSDSGDPFVYRPDLDAPRHPGLLARAQAAVAAPGLGPPWLPALSNHDILLQGLVRPDQALARIAVGGRKLVRPSRDALAVVRGGRIDRARLGVLLAGDRLGTFRPVAPDAARRPLRTAEAVRRLADAAGVPSRPGRLAYRRPIAAGLDVVVLDTADRRGGARGSLPPGELRWRARTLAGPGAERVIVVSPTPLEDTAGGDAALRILDRTPGVVAVLSGDTHRNRIRARRTVRGGYWLVRAPSLIDFPQQVRSYRLVRLAGGRLALDTWLVDHAGSPEAPGALGLAGISRDLAFLDAQGGRPRGWAGAPGDRNARLYLP